MFLQETVVFKNQLRVSGFHLLNWEYEYAFIMSIHCSSDCSLSVCPILHFFLCVCVCWICINKILERDIPEIDSLHLNPGVCMKVYVTEVYGPHKFTVQPIGTELISMMEDMG